MKKRISIVFDIDEVDETSITNAVKKFLEMNYRIPGKRISIHSREAKYGSPLNIRKG